MDIRAHAPALLTGIYAIADAARSDPVALASAAVRGGARIVQYRAKGGIVASHARALRELTLRHGALFIVNDDWRAALKYEADGVHLGPDDASPREVAEIRAAMGERLVGISCGTQSEAREAQTLRADYIGAGSVYATASKADAGSPIGTAGLERIVRATRLPVAAIGGITLQVIPQIRSSGAAMAAVISAIASAPDPQAAAAQLVRAWNAR